MIAETQTEVQQRKPPESSAVLIEAVLIFLKMVAALEGLVKLGLVPPESFEEADALGGY